MSFWALKSILKFQNIVIKIMIICHGLIVIIVKNPQKIFIFYVNFLALDSEMCNRGTYIIDNNVMGSKSSIYSQDEDLD